MTSHWIESFVNDLGNTATPVGLTNIYEPPSVAGRARQQNLEAYLLKVTQSSPQALLVGEAPGYRGTRYTGVPFASERLLCQPDTCARIIGRDRPFTQQTNLPRSEATSTIVWRILDELDLSVALWAVVPFHPHLPGSPDSNRRPTGAEIALGLPFLERIHAALEPPVVLAVGRVAEAALGVLGIAATAVRHPSRGGAQAFRLGLIKAIDSGPQTILF